FISINSECFMLSNLKTELKKLENPERAEILQRFFKTGKGEYGEGDVFLGLNSQQIKDIVKKYPNLSLPKLKELLKSKIHEHRLVGLIILDGKYKKADEKGKENIFNFYLQNVKNVNNWDLVDLSAPNIAGDFLFKRNKNILYKFLYYLYSFGNFFTLKFII
ncbi:DNA alkylation repair protein, partial [bacterium]|nr:DNA alkylation repair protein [bacterium]